MGWDGMGRGGARWGEIGQDGIGWGAIRWASSPGRGSHSLEIWDSHLPKL